MRYGLLTEFKYNPYLSDFENEIIGNDMNEEEVKLKINFKN